MLLMHTLGLQIAIRYCQFALFSLLSFILESASLWAKLQPESQTGQHRAPMSSSCCKDLLNLSFCELCSFSSWYWLFLSLLALNMQGGWVVVFHTGFLSWNVFCYLTLEACTLWEGSMGTLTESPCFIPLNVWVKQKLQPALKRHPTVSKLYVGTS